MMILTWVKIDSYIQLNHVKIIHNRLDVFHTLSFKTVLILWLPDMCGQFVPGLFPTVMERPFATSLLILGILHYQPFMYYYCEGSSPPQNSLTYTLVHHLLISWTLCIVCVAATEYWYLSISVVLTHVLLALVLEHLSIFYYLFFEAWLLDLALI